MARASAAGSASTLRRHAAQSSSSSAIRRLPLSPACQTLCLLVVDQPLQRRAGVFQQQRQAFVQTALTILWRGHAVEPYQCVKPKPGKGFTPFRLAVLAAGDEVEHRQQRLAAVGQHFQFVAVLGQHRLARIDHIQAGMTGQQLAQYLGLLLEALARFAALQKTLQPGRAVQALAWALQAFKVVEQGDGIFQAGRVVQLQQRFTVHRQPCTFHMASSAGAVGHFAKTDVAGQGAQ